MSFNKTLVYADVYPSKIGKWEETAITGMTENIQKAEHYLTTPSWCGSTNIPRCVEIKHLYRCRIHPDHYYRRGGKCIECKAEWERRERAERERNCLKRMGKKARDTNIADCAQMKCIKRKETMMKLRRPGITQIPNVSLVEKPGKWPIKRKQQNPGTQLSPELERALKEDREKEDCKGKAQGLTIYKAKKKWMD